MEVHAPAGDHDLERDLHVTLANLVDGVAVRRQAQRRGGGHERVTLEADGPLGELQAGCDRLELRGRSTAIAQGLNRVHRLKAAAGRDRE